MCNWPTSGNLTGILSPGQGEPGKSLEYEWRGTWLGIRREGEEEYQFVNLAPPEDIEDEETGTGNSGADGREIELQVGNGYIQWRYKDEEEWNNLISIDSLKGEPGEQGLPGKDGKQGPQGLPGRDGVDGKDGKNGIDGTNGQDGADGVTPDIKIGTVTTLEPNQKATVTKRGTKEEPIFDFGIPKGADGTGGSDTGASIDDSTISTNKTWSSSKIEDFVLTNNNTIWKDVNGENLKIEHTKESYLREVEILGNTIQNQDNLEDIQHLGELYVDSEGRKQYKIEIESREALPLSYHQAPRNATINGTYVKLVCDNNTKKWADVIYALNPNDVKIGDIVTLEITILNKTNLKDSNGFYLNNGFSFGNSVTINTTILNKKQVYTTEITKLPDAKQRFLMFGIDDGQLIDRSQEGSIEFHYKIYSNKTKSFKTTILLPCQLMKVGNASDRLYWDSSKGRYVVEKNIMQKLIDSIGTAPANYVGDNSYAYNVDNINSSTDKNFNVGKKDGYLINGFKSIIYSYYNKNSDVWTFDKAGSMKLLIRFPREERFSTVQNTLSYLSENNIRLYYQSKTPELIETNITEELKLPTYINNTYISVNGGIQGSIKAKAPVDGGKVIGALQRENAEIKATNEVQDELINTTMLATDEMFMMLEPLLAELLVNKKSSSKIVNMYVAMVMRGLKKIEDVPSRYREQVKEILMELE